MKSKHLPWFLLEGQCATEAVRLKPGWKMGCCCRGWGGLVGAWKGKLLQWAVHFLFLCCIVLLLKGVHTITTNLNKLWAGHSVYLLSGSDHVIPYLIFNCFSRGKEQDKVIIADSAFIFLIIQSQSQWSGWSGRKRWSCLVWSLLER